MIAADSVNPVLFAAAISAAATRSVAALSFTLSRLAESASRGREHYAAATRELVAWIEMPHRIRRRTSDAPEGSRRARSRLHDGQEALAYRSAWIRSDSRWLAEIFDDVRGRIRCEHGPACGEAWRSPPVSSRIRHGAQRMGPDWTGHPRGTVRTSSDVPIRMATRVRCRRAPPPDLVCPGRVRGNG